MGLRQKPPYVGDSGLADGPEQYGGIATVLNTDLPDVQLDNQLGTGCGEACGKP